MNKKYIFFILSLALPLLVWHIAASRLLQSYFLPKPLEVAKALYILFKDFNFLGDIKVSLIRIIVGFAAASFLAIPVGIAMGINKSLENLFEPFIDFIRYTPIPAFIPLFILWFGIGETEKFVVIFAGVFFQLSLMVMNSISRIPKKLLDAGQTLGANKLQIIWRVIIPWTKPLILDDLRINLGWAWSSLMLAEVVGSTAGIGYVIIQSQRLLKTPEVMAAIVAVGIFGLVSDLIFKQLYKYYFPWANKLDSYART